MKRKIAIKPSLTKTCPYRANMYWYAVDDNTYDGTNEVGVGPTAEDALRDLIEQIECPYCKDVSLTPVDRVVDLKGRSFTAYECSDCGAELTFNE